MKKLKSFFFALCAAAFMVGCSDQIDINEQKDHLIEGDGDGFYMGLDIELPTGNLSRSTTVSGGGSSDGTEIGQDYENVVSNALIILAERGTHNFIAAGEVTSNRLTAITSANNATYKAVAKISKTNLNAFYDELDNSGSEVVVEVFVFCNPTKWLVDKMSNYNSAANGANAWIDYTADVYQGNPEKADYNTGIWSPNSFLMNNVSIVTRGLPKNLLDWENFDKAENPFHLSDNNTVKEGLPDNLTDRGAVKVERSVARFDFKDGSGNKNTYNVLFQADAKTPDDLSKRIPLVSVQLQKMCLVNMSNKFYFLPRVSNNGTNENTTENGWTLCGNEKRWGRNEANGKYENGNYVVGPNWADYLKYWDINNYYNYFNFPFFDENGSFNNGLEAKNQWDVYNIDDVLKGTGDLYTGTNSKPSTPGNYHIWRYVTENVIPADETNQVNAISTGIVFRGRLKGTDEALNGAAHANEETWEEDVYQNLAKCLNGDPFQIRRKNHSAITGVDNNGYSSDPILYYLDGKLYFTWEHLRQAAIQASVTPTWSDNTITSVEINRSNSLYHAVFGDGPIPDGMKYIKDGEKGQDSACDFTDPRWADEKDSEAYKASCNYLWSEWNTKTMKDDSWYVGTISGNNDADLMKYIIAMRKAMTEAGITIYQSSLDPTQSEPGYYCYYYYWNRHNDNGIAGVMGPMEFDVVRNNVYKLSVDNISRLGHPRIPENDPEPPTPDTPDESANIYIDVTVEIADWAVRINGIDF